MACKFEIISTPAGKELKVDLEGCNVLPTLEDNPACMKEVLKILMKVGKVKSISLLYNMEYHYPEPQVVFLNDYAEFLVDVMTKENIDDEVLKMSTTPVFLKYHANTLLILRYLLSDLLFEDPIESYIKLRRIYFIEKSRKPTNEEHKETKDRILLLIERIMRKLEETKLIQRFYDRLREYNKRNFYREIFKPIIRPSFMRTKIMTISYKDIKSIETYFTQGGRVEILKKRNESRFLYFITPPEYLLSKDEMDLLIRARDILGKLRPVEAHLVRFEKLREIVYGMALDIVKREARLMKLSLTPSELEKLARILVKLTTGFGIIEDISADDWIEDIYINPPIGETPIVVKHAKYGEMETNIIPSIEEVRGWVSKIRLLSGRPLDEAHPVLDYDLDLPFARVRIALVQEPFSPGGYAMAIRRHRKRPWTLPLFIKNKMLSSLAAGLIWFLVDGGRTMLIAGTRGAGKTSLLQSIMLQISRRFRIITIEDTLELPVSYFRKLGYNILSLKVRSAVSMESSELSAEDGIRTSLRLGDSCLIIGEVRSLEAKALYEAMRVGAMANVVAGTIHGDSPYSVFDRVVNDIGVPRTSFKATDIIIVANKIRSPGGLREERRVVDISEVRKHWERDPLLERGFVQLMRYDAKKDSLEPTPELIEGDSEILKLVGSRVREFVGRWDKIWNNIILRKRIFEEIIKISESLKEPEILEADFVVLSNDIFANVMDEVREEFGDIVEEEVFKRWRERFLKGIKERMKA